MDLFGETNFLFLTHGDLLYIYQGFIYLKVDQFLVNSIMVLGKLRLRKSVWSYKRHITSRIY